MRKQRYQDSRARSACKRRRRGQSMVELALMMPLLAVIMVGTLDMGRIFFYYTRLSDAVKEGVLFGIHSPDLVSDPSDTTVALALRPTGAGNPNNVKFHTMQESPTYLNLQNANVTVTCYSSSSGATKPCGPPTTAGTARSGDWIAVTATYDFVPITKQLMGAFGGPKWTIRKTAKMRIL
jgi:Flp pilus assembly protein TadG